jgi:hypothetical protein
MADNGNPRDRIPGTRTRFRFPYSDTGYAFIGPAIVIVLVILIGIYTLGDWVGDTDATKTGQSNQPAAVKPDAPPKSPSTTR